MSLVGPFAIFRNVRAWSAFGGKPDGRRTGPAPPLLTDTVEKVSKNKLWKQNLKQSNPDRRIFESMLLDRRSP
jgi:hypothetical protein